MFVGALGIGLAGSPAMRATATVRSQSTSGDASCADAPSLRAKVRQLIFAGFSREQPAQLRVLADNGLGGFFLMGRYETASELDRAKLMLEAISNGATTTNGPKPFVSVDEEGGRVQRLGFVSKEPSARKLGETNDNAALEAGNSIGAKLANLGFNMDFAPDVDTDNRETGVISDRSFSFDPKVVSSRAAAYSRGLTANGIQPVFKHFPGHGRAGGDSHKFLPITPPLSELEKRDLLPFRSAIDSGATAIMMGHLSVPGLTKGNVPTTFSTNAYAYLRNMGFTGIVLTDDLGMGALTSGGSIPNRAVLAIDAGATMVLTATTVGVTRIADALERRAKVDPAFAAKVDAAFASVLRAKQFCLGKRLSTISLSFEPNRSAQTSRCSSAHHARR
jgi:beta-N-acetylhexosaminidase